MPCVNIPTIVASLNLTTTGPHYETPWYTPAADGVFRITVVFISTAALAEDVSFTATDVDGNNQGSSLLSSAGGLFASASKVFNAASGSAINLTIIPNNSYTTTYKACVILEQLS